MLKILVFLIIGFLAFYTATFVIAMVAVNSENFESFIKSILSHVYTIIVIGLTVVFILPEELYLFPLFFLFSFLLTWCFIDYEETYEIVEEYKNDE